MAFQLQTGKFLLIQLDSCYISVSNLGIMILVKGAAIGKSDLNAAGILDNMVIGQDDSRRGDIKTGAFFTGKSFIPGNFDGNYCWFTCLDDLFFLQMFVLGQKTQITEKYSQLRK